MPTMYEITGDLLGLQRLMEEMVDEDGNPREPTEEELDTMRGWFELSEEQFTAKFDSCCKFIKNLKIDAENADAERKSHKAEMDRLSRRSKAFANRADSVKGLLWYSMQRLRLNEFKTSLFSAKEQNTQITVSALDGASLCDVPDEFLKPREIDTAAVKAAIKSGELKCGDGTPLGESKLFFARNGKELKNVRWHQGTALYIR